MKEIPLTKGKFALVDDEDFVFLSQFKWHATAHRRTFYADRNINHFGGRHDTERMHRVIMNAPKGILVDHIDGNGLNNQRSNLRLCNNSQNLGNQPPSMRQGKTSIYKGVYFDKRLSKWSASITCNRQQQHLGYFDNEIDAAMKYDEAAIVLFGEFAYLNIPSSERGAE